MRDLVKALQREADGVILQAKRLMRDADLWGILISEEDERAMKAGDPFILAEVAKRILWSMRQDPLVSRADLPPDDHGGLDSPILDRQMAEVLIHGVGTDRVTNHPTLGPSGERFATAADLATAGLTTAESARLLRDLCVPDVETAGGVPGFDKFEQAPGYGRSPGEVYRTTPPPPLPPAVGADAVIALLGLAATLHPARALIDLEKGVRGVGALGRYTAVPQPLRMRSAPKVAKVIAPDEALHRTMLSKNHQHYLAKFDARKRQRFMQEFGDRYVGDQPYDLTTVALDRLDRRPFNVDEAKVAELMKQPPAKDGHPIIAPNATKSRHAHLILDGNHRVEAALRRGDKTLKAYVRRDIATALDHRTVRKSVDALIDRVRESAARDRAEGNLVMAAMGELFAYNLANPTLEKAQSRVKAHTSHSKTGKVEEVRETTRTTKGAKKADLVEGLAKQRAKKSAPTVAAPGEAAPKVAAKAKTPGKAIASPASEPVTSEHWIPVDNLRELRDKIGTLNKKAAKMGLAPITLQEHEQALRKTPIQVDYIPPGPGAPGGPVIKHMSVMHRRVTVTGEAPRLGGWDVVGAIEHTGGERNIVHAFGGHKPPKDAAHRAGDCDHCGHIRKRTKTYLLKRGKTIQQVGKTCLKDFTGHPDPERLASGAEWLDGAMRDLGDEFSGGSAGHGYTPIEPYLAHVARSIHHDGWISKQKAEEQIMESTASAAADTMRRGSPTGKPVTDDHRKLAKAAVAWVRDTLAKKKGLSDYESNLVAVVSQDAIKGRHMGIAASAIPVYQREMERQAHAKTVAKIAKNRTSNEFFGKEGERHDLDLTLAEPPHPYTSSYGTSYIHKFIDGEGRSFSWFSPRDEGIKPGQTVRITGTIKSHREFKGIKETSLGRVTLWTPQAIAAAHAKAAKKAAKSAKPLSKALGLGDRKTGPGDLTADLEAAFAVKLDPDGAWQPMTRAEVVALPAPIRPVGPDSRSDYTKKLARLAARRAGLPEPPR